LSDRSSGQLLGTLAALSLPQGWISARRPRRSLQQSKASSLLRA